MTRLQAGWVENLGSIYVGGRYFAFLCRGQINPGAYLASYTVVNASSFPYT